MIADQIRRELERRGSRSPVLELCLRLVEFVAELPADQRSMLTYRVLARGCAKSEIDAELVAATNLLSTSTLKAFDFHALFVDDNDEEFELSADEVAQANETGIFVHPDTGVPVEDFRNKIIPFFVPTHDFGSTK